jgi:GTPase SAR1 family protein
MAAADDIEVFKICVLGDPKSGRTSLVRALREGGGSGINSSVRDVAYIEGGDDATGKRYMIQFWDTPGLRADMSDLNVMLSGSSGVLIMFDLTNRRTFESIDRWAQAIAERYKPRPSKPSALMPFIYLVGCKLELAERGARQVEWDEIDAKATENGWGCAQITAVEPCLNVLELLEEMSIEILLDRVARAPAAPPRPASPPTSPRKEHNKLWRLMSAPFHSKAKQ